MLLVDDDPNDVELFLTALEREHLASKVHVVHDGVEALDFLFARGSYAHPHIEDVPKVVLLDLRMPKLSGFDVLERIRSSPQTKEIPVVVFSSSRHVTDLAQAYASGANSYVVKPVEFDDLMLTIGGIGRYWLILNQLT